jgi:fluoride ion exporter CrcB/FEX
MSDFNTIVGYVVIFAIGLIWGSFLEWWVESSNKHTTTRKIPIGMFSYLMGAFIIFVISLIGLGHSFK